MPALLIEAIEYFKINKILIFQPLRRYIVRCFGFELLTVDNISVVGKKNVVFYKKIIPHENLTVGTKSLKYISNHKNIIK